MLESKPILVIGATGYVGGRLTPRLLEAGYRVRVIGRSMDKMACRAWSNHPQAELVQADVLDQESLEQAAQGCRIAYYLVHSMTAGKDGFAQTDRLAAQNMVKAAASSGLDRIIYLGGLGQDQSDLSNYLRSRIEVARILQSGRVPVTFLRAAVILGVGSASFEILRYLVDRLPVMITPKWVRTMCQPIAIGNVLNYLEGCLEKPATVGQTYDLGGPDILSYQQLMEIYAQQAGLKRRWIVPVPFLSPRLSSYWVHLVTPVPSYLARPLIEGLKNPMVCQENRIRSVIPQNLSSCKETISLALSKISQHQVETCWSDAGCPYVPEWVGCGDEPYAGGTVLKCGYRAVLKATSEDLWTPIRNIGGQTGWYSANILWVMRGLMDRLMGGIGLERGRRHPEEIRVGDALDFWRVLEVEKPYKLRLVAEMRMPGEAILEFSITPFGEEQTEIKQLASFLPRGLFGILYWYSLYPIHQGLFKGMLRGIAKSAGRPIVKGPERFA